MSPLPHPPTLDSAPLRRSPSRRDRDEPPLQTNHLRARYTEFAVPIALGLLLWSVVCWEALSIELAAPDTRMPQVLLLVQPLVILALGLLRRSSPFVLVGFPTTLLIATFGLEPLDLVALANTRGALTLSGALLLFVFGVARYGPSKASRTLLVGERLRAGLDARHRLQAISTWTRGALLLAVLLLPLHALYGEVGRQRLADTFGPQQSDAAALIHTIHLFVAVLAGAMFFLSPHINLALDVQELQTKVRAARRPDRARNAWRTIAILLALGGATVAFFLSHRAP